MKSPIEFKQKKIAGQKISMVTCYDAWSAKIIAKSKIDTVLVGDSVSMVVHGFDSTIHATIDMMELHTAAVKRGLAGGSQYLVTDMPFLAHKKGVSYALEAAGRFARAGAQAVKIENVRGHEDVIKALVDAGIPVMGHLGLTPQSALQLGAMKVQGKSSEDSEKIYEDALALEKLGAFALVLECVPRFLSEKITTALSIPTIGIGAGDVCDGQVLVLQDLLGMDNGFKPKFLRRFLDGENLTLEALNEFAEEVAEKKFPLLNESYL